MSDQGYEYPEYDNVDELQSAGAESEDADEVNRNLFRDKHGIRTAFFLHESIKGRFSRQNLTRDIEVRHELSPAEPIIWSHIFMIHVSFVCRSMVEL